MPLSIQTNVASLTAQNNIRINTNFQANTINQLSSGFRINSSADDAAGLAVANKYRGVPQNSPRVSSMRKAGLVLSRLSMAVSIISPTFWIASEPSLPSPPQQLLRATGRH